MVMTAADIIPQRYPFAMIDKIVTVTPKEQAVAIKNLTINEWYFQNQVPPLTAPKSMMIEAMAQTGAVAILSAPEFAGHNVLFGGIKQAEFIKPFNCGDQLVITVQLTKLKNQVGLGHAVITTNEEVTCTADLMFAIVKEWGWSNSCLTRY